jgi:hypothetical protein
MNRFHQNYFEDTMSKEEKCSEGPSHCYCYNDGCEGKPICNYQEKELCFDCYEELLDPTQVNTQSPSQKLYSLFFTPVGTVISSVQVSATIDRYRILASDPLQIMNDDTYQKDSESSPHQKISLKDMLDEVKKN